LARFKPTSTSLWCTGQCPVPRLARRRTGCTREMKKAAQLKFTGLSGVPEVPVANGHLSDHGRHVAKPTVDWSHRTVRCASDSVRCASGPGGPTVGCARYGRKSSTGQVLSCPVEHRTVRCTTKQKARFSFQVDLQQLLAALGL
jgi:hypothetical protein